MYKLVIEDDEGGKSVVPVIRDEITIGRKEGNTIRLTERNVSRRHARLVRDNGRVYLEEVAARYGLKKNGSKISERVEFKPGDVIQIGDYRLRLEPEKQEATAPGAPPPEAAGAPPAGAAAGPEREEGTAVMPAMPAKLVVVSSNFAGQEFPLNRKEMIVGRGDDCDIIVDHRSVSQKHAKIIREQGGKYQIVDLNSKNGVNVSGEQYKSVHLKRGDVIELGHVKFRFVEPGENYVFTPQPGLDGLDADDDTGIGAGTIAGVLVVVALLAAGAFFVLSSNGDGGAAGEFEATAVAANGETGAAEQAPPAPAAPDDPVAEATPANKVDEAIDSARANIAAGQLDKAMGVLDSAEQFLEPEPAQQDKIDELRAQAKREKPSRHAYQAAKNAVGKEEYAEGLEYIEKIPPHSVFQQIIAEEGLNEKALQGLIARARELADKGKDDEARQLAEAALAHDSSFEPAQALLDEFEQAEIKQAMAMKEPAPSAKRPSNSGGSSGGTTGGSSGSSKPAPPKADKPSPAEAKELFMQAQKKIFKNDSTGAISDCNEALKGGYRACYRVLGIAYKQQGNTGAACKNFKRYLSTNPGNAGAIQREMDKLGCQ